MTRKWGRKCPICGCRMVDDCDYLDLTLLESEERCEGGCKRYGEHFITGAYDVAIKMDDGEWKIWRWTYTEAHQDLKAISDEIKEVIEQVKEERR